MSMQNKHVKWIIIVILTVCLFASSPAPSCADAGYTLILDYSSVAEKKLVITGPRHLIPLASERVYTESELGKFKGTELFYVTAIEPVLNMYVYKVDGVSMWDVFADAGIKPELYGDGTNYLQSVSASGQVTTIGPEVMIPGTEVIIPGMDEIFYQLTGALDEPRYNYPIAEFMEFSGKEAKKIPPILGFAETRAAAVDKTSTIPEEATDNSRAIGVYFGQLNAFNNNKPLFNNNVYRLVLSDSRLSGSAAANASDAAVFSLFGTDYDRANILTGPKGTGEKVRGRFITGGKTVYIEGTSVKSLLPAGMDDAGYVSFSNGALESVIVTAAEIIADNYTVVSASGDATGDLQPIKRNINGRDYFFDLYRDGAPVVQNISALAASGPPNQQNTGNKTPDNSNSGTKNTGAEKPDSKRGNFFSDILDSGSVLAASAPFYDQAFAKWVNPFSDVPEYAYYYNGVRFVVENGLFNGVSATAFGPELPLSRAMAATILWRFAGYPSGGRHSFIDVPSSAYYHQAVGWAAFAGIIYGYNEGLFSPDDPVTGEQLITILYRYAQAAGYDVSAAADFSLYGDAPDISPYALDAWAWAVETGLINDLAEGILPPKGEVSRAEAAMILSRLIAPPILSQAAYLGIGRQL